MLKGKMNTPSACQSTGVLKGQDIICFSHDWTGDPLSKTHLMRVLSRDNRILWINSLANRALTTSSKDFSRILLKLRGFSRPIEEVEKNIFVLNPLAVPAYGNFLIRSFNRSILLGQVRRAMRRLKFFEPINIVFNPAAGLLAGKLGEKTLIYYCVDEYTAFTGISNGLKEIEEDLFRRSDVVIVSAEKLYRSKRRFNKNTFILRHGTDWQHFQSGNSPDLAVPSDIADLSHPIIGFHGLLADWVDYELIKKVADHFDGGSIVLIGKISVDAEKKVELLRNVDNIHFLGRKPYSELPAYCKGFDVALNPFLINRLTLAANPLKVREYLAAGLMVISTDIPEVHDLEGCFVSTDHDDFIKQIEAALHADRPRGEISETMRSESWDARVDELREILKKCERKDGEAI